MRKPKRLKPGDKVAVVSLSWGGLGDPSFIHKYYIAKERLEQQFGLQVVAMPHALKGSDFIAQHPELRAKDLMEAFADPTISAIFCAIGGDDTIRTLPYIDFDCIRNNPKIFMGYSDTTINHFMMYHARLISFYGPSVLCEFGEYVEMFAYTSHDVQKIFFEDSTNYVVESSPQWSKDFVNWDEANCHVKKSMQPDEHGYEVLQGTTVVTGHLLGGCLDVFSMVIGTKIWPTLDQWRGAILFLETSEEKPAPQLVKYALRNLAAQGILQVIHGIIVGKPQQEVYYEEYKAVLHQVVCVEEGLCDLPIFYNVNIGHAQPIGILPYGIQAQLNCHAKTITLLESAAESAD